MLTSEELSSVLGKIDGGMSEQEIEDAGEEGRRGGGGGFKSTLSISGGPECGMGTSLGLRRSNVMLREVWLTIQLYFFTLVTVSTLAGEDGKLSAEEFVSMLTAPEK